MSRERDIYRLKDLFYDNILMKKGKTSVGNVLRNFILKILVYHILSNLLNWGQNYQKVMPGVNKWVYYMTKAIVLPYLQWYAWLPLYLMVIFSLMYKVCDKLGHLDEIQLGPKMYHLNMVSHPSYVSNLRKACQWWLKQYASTWLYRYGLLKWECDKLCQTILAKSVNTIYPPISFLSQLSIFNMN